MISSDNTVQCSLFFGHLFSLAGCGAAIDCVGHLFFQSWISYLLFSNGVLIHAILIYSLELHLLHLFQRLSGEMELDSTVMKDTRFGIWGSCNLWITALWYEHRLRIIMVLCPSFTYCLYLPWHIVVHSIANAIGHEIWPMYRLFSYWSNSVQHSGRISSVNYIRECPLIVISLSALMQT